MTIEYIFERVPDLKDELDGIMAAESNIDLAYIRCKASAEESVGFGAKDPKIRTMAAHMCIVDYIADRLGI